MPRRTRQKGGDNATPYDLVAQSATLVGDQSSKYVVFNLPAGLSIISDVSFLVYLKGDVSKGEIAMNADIWSSFARAFGGETVLFQKYTGGTKSGAVALGTSLPGDIVMIPIGPGETYLLSSGSFLASTENIKISGSLKLMNLLPFGSEEGVVLTSATCTNNNTGYIWVAAYGAFERHELKAESDEMIVNNGMFLACNRKESYTLATLGKSLASTLLGEGLGMKFKGPCIVYTQSKNLNGLAAFVASVAPSRSGGAKKKRVTKK
jgi:uncharacterized protein (AIM24 family)